MRKVVLIIIVALCAVGSVQAAEITWGTATDVSGAIDVSTLGSLVVAENAYVQTNVVNVTTVDPIVNGVQFIGTKDLLDKVHTSGSVDFFDSDTGDVGYNDLLSSADFSSYANEDLTLGGTLVVDQQYLIQVWFADTRKPGRKMQFTNGNTVELAATSTSGPAWLTVATSGALSGTPANSDVGANVFTVQVSDGNGGTDTATLNITVDAAGGTPHSQTIVVVDGWDSKNEKSFVDDGKVYVFTSSDDDRWDVEKGGYYSSFEFSNISFGTGAVITNVTVNCEHYEESGYSSGDLEWNVGTNWPSSPTTWGTLSPAPTNIKESNETTDSWDVTSYVNSTTLVNDLEFRIKNNSGNKKTKPDYIYVTVEWTE